MARRSSHACEKWWNEQRAGVQEVDAVQVLPLVGHGPRIEARFGERMRRRAEAERVEQQCLAVALPAVVQETAFGLPTMHHGRPLGLRPVPVDAAVEVVRELAQLALVGARLVEVRGGGEHAGEKQRAVDQRQLALPRPRAAVHVQEVEVEAVTAGRSGLTALVAVPEEAQGREAALHRRRARHPAAFDRDRIHRQRETRHRDARVRTGARGVGDEAIGGVRVRNKIVERGALQIVEHRDIGCCCQRGCLRSRCHRVHGGTFMVSGCAGASAASTVACASFRICFRCSGPSKLSA